MRGEKDEKSGELSERKQNYMFFDKREICTTIRLMGLNIFNPIKSGENFRGKKINKTCMSS